MIPEYYLNVCFDFRVIVDGAGIFVYENDL